MHSWFIWAPLVFVALVDWLASWPVSLVLRQASDGDDDLSPGVPLLQVPDGLGCFAQRVGPVALRRALLRDGADPGGARDGEGAVGAERRGEAERSAQGSRESLLHGADAGGGKA
jgi:hypothetical protein